MLGEQIRKLRLARNLSQVELANKLNVTKQSVSTWENNNIMPSIDLLKRMCNVFSCSADYILELEHDGVSVIETTGLTLEEIAHIQQIVRDLQYLESIRQAQQKKNTK